MSQHETDSTEEGTGESVGRILDPEEVPEDASVVDLTDEANQRWLDEPGFSRPPITERSDEELDEFAEQLDADDG